MFPHLKQGVLQAMKSAIKDAMILHKQAQEGLQCLKYCYIDPIYTTDSLSMLNLTLKGNYL